MDDGSPGTLEGCLVFIGWAALAALALLLGTCAYSEWDEPRGRLPPTVHFSRVLFSDSQSGFREGCGFAVYELTRRSANALIRRGVDSIEGQPPVKDSARNPYGPWRPTPLAVDIDNRYRNPESGGAETLYALHAAGGCASRGGSVPFSDLWTVLRRPGSIYSITRNGEGLVVIEPRRRLAAWMYFG